MTTAVLASDKAVTLCNECGSQAQPGSTKKAAEEHAYTDGFYTITFYIRESKFTQHACSRRCKNVITTRLQDAQIEYTVTGYFVKGWQS